MLGAVACLTLAIYFEARSEPLKGQYAVGEVILNRVESRHYPDTVCGVISEDRGPKARDCQFSFYCDGQPEDMKAERPRQRAHNVAKDLLEGQRTRYVSGALFYHNTSVNPKWARSMRKTAQIGNHIFYRSK